MTLFRLIIPDKPRQISAGLKEFLIKMLTKDPLRRPSVEELSMDSWLNDYGNLKPIIQGCEACLG